MIIKSRFKELVRLKTPTTGPRRGSDGKYRFFYRTTCTVTHKVYFGIHTGSTIDDEYLGSGSFLKAAIHKHGIENFFRVNLKYFRNRESLLAFEKKTITVDLVDFMLRERLGYNLRHGGDGGWFIGSTSIAKLRVKDGTHNFQTRADGSNLATDRVSAGTHPFLTRKDGTNTATDRVRNKTHPFMRRQDGSSLAQDRLKNGTHNWTTVDTWLHTSQTPKARLLWYLAVSLSKLSAEWRSCLQLRKISELISSQSIKTLNKKLARGWSPIKDQDWLDFRESSSKLPASEFLRLFGCTKVQSKSLERKISLVDEEPNTHKIMVSINGKRLLFSEAHRQYGKVKLNTAYARLRNGWSALEALTHTTLARI